MWVFTLDGFYSAVANTQRPGYLLVRCRDEDDAQRLSDWLKARRGYGHPVRHTPEADYPYRLDVLASAWGNYVAECAVNIDYPNFKNEVAKTLGSDRAWTYEEVWLALRQLHVRST